MANRVPRYDLSPDELADLESHLVAEVHKASSAPGITVAWIRPDHPFSDVVRCSEAKLFPEVVEVSRDDELRSLFMVLVDTRPEVMRAVHAGTVSGSRALANTRSDHSSGMITVDALIAPDNFTLQEFRDFYTARGLNLDACIAVETNFHIVKRARRWNGMPVSNIAYMAYFSELVRQGAELGTYAIFASMNSAQVVALRRMEFRFEPLMDREDLVTPEAAMGVQTLPVVIYVDLETYTRLAVDIGLHEIWF